MENKKVITYSSRRCLFCNQIFQPSTSKHKTCDWKCRFRLLQSDFAPTDDCWIWPQSCNPQTGYGQFHTEGEKKRNQSAHRLSHILNIGEIPDGLLIMHSCDNRKCFNPRHLSAGTHAENLADMRAKGRAGIQNRPKLENNHNSKLTVAAVLEIRSSNLTEVALAEKFGVSKTAIHSAKKGLTWKTAAAYQQICEEHPQTS